MMRTLRPRAALTTVALAGTLAAGCGSSTPSGTDASDAGVSAPASGGGGAKLTAGEKAVKFAACMRAHGVRDFPDPTDKNADNYGVSVTPAVFTRAIDGCKALKPPGALSMKYTRQQLSAAVRFAQCVREQGVKDFPDPVNGEPLINTYKIPSSNRPGGMTVLNAATTKCASLLRQAAKERG